MFVIVVTYNGCKWVEKCFGSLMNSSIPLKIMVVDNGSSDGTLEMIRKNFSKVEIVETRRNLGFGKANNIGIKRAYEAGAEYVFLLNQDAWVEPDTLEKLVDAAVRFPEYGIISPVHLNGAGTKLDRNFSDYIIPLNCPDLYSDMWVGRLKDQVYNVDFVNAAAWLMRRETIATIGGFNPIFFAYCEDDNYIHRMRFHELKIGVFPHSNVYHDRGDRTTSTYFSNEFDLELRRVMLKYADPGAKYTIYHFIALLFGRVFLNGILFRASKMQYSIKLLRMIFKLAPKIEETKKRSRMTGLIFL
jgi:GT2 family glycosyltransferase